MVDLANTKKRSLFKKIMLNIMPSHTLILVRSELKLFRIRVLSNLTYSRWVKKLSKFEKPYKINIAPGKYGKEGWINLDCAKNENIMGIFDLRKNIPLPDLTAEMIFCEHFLVHLDFYEEAPFFLKECYRVLIEGGVIRLIVPNTVAYMRAYFNEGGLEVMTHLRNTEKYSTKMEIINRVFRQGGQHKFAYDAETLLYILKQARFEPSIQSFGKSQRLYLALDRQDRARESIYIEGLKS